MSHPVPAEKRIALLFEKFSSFVEGYASNLSLGGMFLETEEPRPVGSIVDFEIKLTDGFRLIQGLGEVVWVRREPSGSDRPRGLGLRFQALDDKGRELILKIMEERVRSGSEAFDVEKIPRDAAIEARGGKVAAREGSGPPPAGAAVAPPMPQSPTVDLEQKILGEDGFTLLDAEPSRQVIEASQPAEDFEELAFDAPWGDALPELPDEVLTGDLGRDLMAAAIGARQGESFAKAEAESSRAEPFSPSQRLRDEEYDLHEASLVLAQEAADEIELVPPPREVLGEPDFDEIDFGVTFEPGGDGMDLVADLEPADFTLELDPEDQLLASDSVADADASQDDLLADSVSGEDPTLIGAGSVALAEEPATPAAEPLGPVHATELPAATRVLPEPEALSVAAAQAPAGSLPVAPAVESAIRARPAQPGAEEAPQPTPAWVAGDPAEIQDYEDDLFADRSEAGPSQVFRRALGGKSLAIAVLLALVATAYFFRGPLGALVGLTPSVAESVIEETGGLEAVAAPARPAPPVETPPAGAASMPGVEAPGTVMPAVKVPASSPQGGGDGDLEAEPAEVPPAMAPVDMSPATEPEAPVLDSPTAPATRVEQITWRRSGEGTWVTVKLNGGLDGDRYFHLALEYNLAREMIRIAGIDQAYVTSRIEVESPELERIRIGHHTQTGTPEIHVVFDYPSVGPKVVAMKNLGDRLEILIARP